MVVLAIQPPGAEIRKAEILTFWRRIGTPDAGEAENDDSSAEPHHAQGRREDAAVAEW